MAAHCVKMMLAVGELGHHVTLLKVTQTDGALLLLLSEKLIIGLKDPFLGDKLDAGRHLWDFILGVGVVGDVNVMDTHTEFVNHVMEVVILILGDGFPEAVLNQAIGKHAGEVSGIVHTFIALRVRAGIVNGAAHLAIIARTVV